MASAAAEIIKDTRSHIAEVDPTLDVVALLCTDHGGGSDVLWSCWRADPSFASA